MVRLGDVLDFGSVHPVRVDRPADSLKEAGPAGLGFDLRPRKSPQIRSGDEMELPSTTLLERHPAARATENEVIEEPDSDDLTGLGEAPGEGKVLG